MSHPEEITTLQAAGADNTQREQARREWAAGPTLPGNTAHTPMLAACSPTWSAKMWHARTFLRAARAACDRALDEMNEGESRKASQWIENAVNDLGAATDVINRVGPSGFEIIRGES